QHGGHRHAYRCPMSNQLRGTIRTMFTRTLTIAIKELRQLRRDRLTLAMTVALPLLQLLLFGYAINTDVRHIATVVYDQDRSAESRDFYRSLEATGFYDVVGHVQHYNGIQRSFRNGHARVGIVIPAGFSERLALRETAAAQLVVDGSDPLVVGSATNTATALAAARSAQLRIRHLPVGSAGPGIHIEPTIWYNPELRTAVYVVPGLIGVILTMTM